MVHLTVCYHIMYKFQSESTLYSLPERQGTLCSKQVPYLKFKWQQRDSNSQPFSSQTNTQSFSQTSQMIELCCEYLSVWCIWLYVVMSHTSFTVNLHSIVSWMSRNSFLEAGAISEVKVTATWFDHTVFVYRLSGCGFKSRFCHLRFVIFNQWWI